MAGDGLNQLPGGLSRVLRVEVETDCRNQSGDDQVSNDEIFEQFLKDNIGMFKNFAELIAFHLDAQARAARQDAALLDAQEAAKLREQFVAILAHDLRNPLASINAGVSVIGASSRNAAHSARVKT